MARTLADLDGGAELPAAGAVRVNPAEELRLDAEATLRLREKASGEFFEKLTDEIMESRRLLQGLVVEGDALPIVAKARDKGLLISVAGGNVVRFAPALVVTKGEIDEAVEKLDAALGEG